MSCSEQQNVAIGIIYNSSQEILLAWRGAHQNQGSCWEFPGGKIELGENSFQALCRELKEEINITVEQAKLLPLITHNYEKNQVVLYPWQVEKFSGIPSGLQGQSLLWIALVQLPKMTLPAANYEIVNYLLESATS